VSIIYSSVSDASGRWRYLCVLGSVWGLAAALWHLFAANHQAGDSVPWAQPCAWPLSGYGRHGAADSALEYLIEMGRLATERAYARQILPIPRQRHHSVQAAMSALVIDHFQPCPETGRASHRHTRSGRHIAFQRSGTPPACWTNRSCARCHAV